MGHRKLRRPRAEHHQQRDKEYPGGKERFQRDFVLLRRRRRQRHPDDTEKIDQGHGGPQQRIHPPHAVPRDTDADRGRQDDQHLSPGIKGVEQAHRGGFGLPRQGIDDGADEHLDQPSPYRVDDDGQGQPGIWIGQQTGQGPQHHQTGDGTDMGEDEGGAIADFIDEFDREQVHHQLGAERQQDQAPDLFKRHVERGLENHEKQGGKVGDNRLHDIPPITGVQGVRICKRFQSHKRSPCCLLLCHSTRFEAGCQEGLYGCALPSGCLFPSYAGIPDPVSAALGMKTAVPSNSVDLFRKTPLC